MLFHGCQCKINKIESIGIWTQIADFTVSLTTAISLQPASSLNYNWKVEIATLAQKKKQKKTLDKKIY